MNSLGWSRREPDIPVNTSQQSGLLSSIKSLNPFGNGGYVRLPTMESEGAPLPAASRREEEDAWFARELVSTSLDFDNSVSGGLFNNGMLTLYVVLQSADGIESSYLQAAI